MSSAVTSCMKLWCLPKRTYFSLSFHETLILLWFFFLNTATHMINIRKKVNFPCIMKRTVKYDRVSRMFISSWAEYCVILWLMSCNAILLGRYLPLESSLWLVGSNLCLWFVSLFAVIFDLGWELSGLWLTNPVTPVSKFLSMLVFYISCIFSH